MTGIGSKTLLCNLLEQQSKLIISYSIENGRAETQTSKKGKKLDKISNDFNFLIRSSCNKNKVVRTLSQTLSEKYLEYFPEITLVSCVLENVLDTISALHKRLRSDYSGQSEKLELLLSN